jgi:CRP-like cAMP-binding protein
VKHGFFGERSVLTNEVRTASVVAQGPVKCLVLHRQEFLTVMDESVTKLFAHRLELQDDTVTLSQLSVIKELGKECLVGCMLWFIRLKARCML